MASARAAAAAAASAKQVTRKNFAEAVRELEAQLKTCDYVAVAALRTGGPTGWRRALAVDTPETAYLKAKLAAESFQPLHIAVCPFRLQTTAPSTTLVAYPYNFHLFPRDELQLGMPSYIFSCQSSYLSSMAHNGFDFNTCIYDGISYLSRVQESLARRKISIPRVCELPSSPSTSVADSVFMNRIKSRIQHWRKGQTKPSEIADGSLVSALRKIIGDGLYGSRPSIIIDVCSDRQVLLVLKTINHISDDLVPVTVPDKAGLVNSVRVIFTSSPEDKNLLLMDIKKSEDEHNMMFRGFREVIDLLSSSHKPIVSYNCLNDLTMIHSKFVAPLPPTLHEFMCSMRMVFSNVVDISHMWRKFSPLRRAQNIQAALSYLHRQYFVLMEVEIPQQDGTNSVTKNGENVMRITKLFAKLSSLLKLSSTCQPQSGERCHTVEEYCNIFYPSCIAEESDDVDCAKKSDTTRTVSTDNVIFLWGFREVYAKELRSRLTSLHQIFSKDFELQLLDKTCSALIFADSATAMELLREISLENPSLNDFFAEGLKVAGFDMYRKVCQLGLWDSELAEALEGASSEPVTSTFSEHGISEIYWNSSLMLNPKEYLEC